MKISLGYHEKLECNYVLVAWHTHYQKMIDLNESNSESSENINIIYSQMCLMLIQLTFTESGY